MTIFTLTVIFYTTLLSIFRNNSYITHIVQTSGLTAYSIFIAFLTRKCFQFLHYPLVKFCQALIIFCHNFYLPQSRSLSNVIKLAKMCHVNERKTFTLSCRLVCIKKITLLHHKSVIQYFFLTCSNPVSSLPMCCQRHLLFRVLGLSWGHHQEEFTLWRVQLKSLNLLATWTVFLAK